jgi:hypothetical protein
MSKAVSGPSGLIRQGDVLLVPVEGIPEDGDQYVADRHVLARGEASGHAHVAVGRALRLQITGWRRPWGWRGPAERSTFLVVEDDDVATLVHEEHLPITVPSGTYEVRRQREYRPDSWVEVAD